MGKHLTIVLITEKTSKVKKLRIPINLLFFLSILIIGAFSFTGYVYYFYYTNAEKVLNIDELRVMHDRKDLKIDSYYKHLSEMALNLDQLNETRKKMKVLTGLELAENTELIETNEKKLLKKYSSAADPTILNIIDDLSELNSLALNDKTMYYDKFVNYVTTKNIRQYPYLAPSGVPAEGIILSGFQYETDPFSSHAHLLNGVTIGVNGTETNITSTGDGIVTHLGNDEKKGQFVEIYHNTAYKTHYSLLGNVSVQVGDFIKKNQKIGTAGKGQEFAIPHYHYEVLLFNISQNPNKYRSSEYLADMIQ